MIWQVPRVVAFNSLQMDLLLKYKATTRHLHAVVA
jgi:hypothetical protein